MRILPIESKKLQKHVLVRGCATTCVLPLLALQIVAVHVIFAVRCDFAVVLEQEDLYRFLEGFCLIHVVAFFGIFNCIVCLLGVFVCMLCEFCASQKLP